MVPRGAAAGKSGTVTAMSGPHPQQPHPGRPPHGGPPPPTGPVRYRPQARWWWVGGLLLVAAAAAFALGLFLTLRGFLATDGDVPVDGSPTVVTLGDTGERFVWAPAASTVGCTVTDTASGAELPLRGTGVSYTRSAGQGDQRAIGSFRPTSTEVEVACTGQPGAGVVQVGPAVDGSRFVGGVVLSVLGPLVLGLAGFVVLLVTLILTLSRPPRP